VLGPDFNTMLSQHGGSFIAAREAIANREDTRCKCELFSHKQKGLICTAVQEYLSARQNQVSETEALFALLSLAKSAGDIQYARKALCTITDLVCRRDELPSAFGSIFCHLKRLNLESNGLTALPETVFQCGSLEELSLRKNRIAQLSSIENLTNLKNLDLSDNKMKWLPRGMSMLKQLHSLCVARNELCTLYLQPDSEQRSKGLYEYQKRNEVQDESDWKEIRDPEQNRIVYYNNKSGEVTNTMPRFSSSNDGSIKELSTSNLSSPRALDWEIRVGADSSAYYYNHLTNERVSEAPDCLECIGNLKCLKVLDVGDNQLNSFPRSLTKLSLLEVLEAPNNRIVDAAPLCKLSLVRVLNLSKNKIRAIPREMATTVEQLDISCNCLESFPVAVLEMKMLQSLDLNTNLITSIPCKLGYLEHLQYLNLTNNCIHDPPHEKMIQSTEKVLWTCRQLHMRRQKADPIVPHHPSGICFERSALVPDFHSRITQMIEECASSDLGLDLQFMNIHTVPSQVFNSTSIERIDLSYNPLLRVEVAWSHPMQHLHTLIMRGCQLDELHGSIKNLANLKKLDLSDNKILFLPRELTSLPLRYLNLSKNQIECLPESIGDLKELIELNVDHNELLRFPEGMQQNQNLKVLSATHNVLRDISSSITSIASLRELNLSRNCIKMVPESIGRLTLMKLSLSFNQIDLLEDSCFCPHLNSTL